jgi:hypothetical protein
MTPFVTERDRSASAVFQGLFYQLDTTILQWAKLQDNEALELERGEDIDQVAEQVHTASPGQRLLQQIKDLSRPLTLRSAACLEAIANAIEHDRSNPNLTLFFRFITTATATVERPSPFRDGSPGLHVWAHLKGSALVGQAAEESVGFIRQLLLQAKRPAKLNQVTWGHLQSYLKQATVAEFLGFIKRFEWSLGNSTGQQLTVEVCRVLAEQRFAPDAIAASTLHSRLIRYLLELIRKPGIARITRADLVAECQREVLSSTELVGINLMRGAAESIAAAAMNSSQCSTERFISPALPTPRRNLPPASIFEVLRCSAVSDLARVIATCHWTVIIGGQGSGKTRLASQYIRERCVPYRYVSFRDLNGSQANAAIEQLFTSSASAFAELSGLSAEGLRGALILDDLPTPVGMDRLAQSMIQLATRCESLGIRLITLGPSSLPPQLRECFPPGKVVELPVPLFDTSACRDLLLQMGAADSGETSSHAETIAAIARGNATLCVAYARLLAGSSFTLDHQSLLDLGSRVDIPEIIDSAKRLASTIRDLSARDLLYRLCLSRSSFDITIAQSIAACARPISHCLDRINALRGSWLEEIAPGRMAVSPLIRPHGEAQIVGEVRKQVYKTLADCRLSGGISVLDVPEVVNYLIGASDFERLGAFLLSALQHGSSLPDIQRPLLLTATFAYGPLPAEMPPRARLMVRMAHVVLTRGRDQAVCLDGMAGDLEQVDDIAIALPAAMLAAIASESLSEAIWFIERAVGEYRRQPDCDEETRRLCKEITSEGPPCVLLWLAVRFVRSAADLVAFTQAAWKMTPHEKQALGGSEHSWWGSKLAVEHTWMGQAKGELAGQTWEDVLTAFQEFGRLAESCDSPSMWAASIRGQIIVFAEFLKDLDEPLSMVRDCSKHRLFTDPVAFLLYDTMARNLRHGGRVLLARQFAQMAISSECGPYSALLPRSYIEASLTYSVQEIGDATIMLGNGLRMASELSTVPKEEIACLLFELGVACWEGGDSLGAFDAFHSAFQLVEETEGISSEWKPLIALAGHAIGFMSQACMGQAPEFTSHGDVYMPPYRGMFIQHRPRLDEWFDESGYTDTMSFMLPISLALWANAVGRLDRARELALVARERAVSAGMLEVVTVASHILMPQLIVEGEMRESLLTSYDAAAAFVLLKDDRNLLQQMRGGRSLADLGVKPNEKWNQVDSYTVEQGAVPAVLHLCKLRIIRDPSFDSLADELLAAFVEFGAGASDASLWAALCRATQSFRDDKWEVGWGDMPDNSGVKCCCYAMYTLSESCTLETAAILHAELFRMLAHERPLNGEELFALVELPFLASFWTNAISTQAFRFRAPRLVHETLAGIDNLPLLSRPRALLNEIFRGLQIRTGPKLRYLREWLGVK